MDKRCKHCGSVKSTDDFYRNNVGADGLRPECKACTAAKRAAWYAENASAEKARVKEWQQANRERVNAGNRDRRRSPEARRAQRDSHLRRKYGIGADDYDELLRSQNGVCAICLREPNPNISLHVDHDHETGEIRGLLCFCCNNALGDFEDDYERLAAAVRYLRPPAVDEALDELVRARVADLVASGSAVTN
jgi:hypothetical protein